MTMETTTNTGKNKDFVRKMRVECVEAITNIHFFLLFYQKAIEILL